MRLRSFRAGQAGLSGPARPVSLSVSCPSRLTPAQAPKCDRLPALVPVPELHYYIWQLPLVTKFGSTVPSRLILDAAVDSELNRVPFLRTRYVGIFGVNNLYLT